MRKKRISCAALALAAMLYSVLPVQALQQVTSWAQAEVAAASKAGFEPKSLENAKATGSITRAEFCEIALRLYEKISGEKVPTDTKSPFTDTSGAAVAAANQLGLVSGRGGGVFDPSGAITRQELCVILSNVLKVAGLNAPSIDPEVIGVFPDRGKVAVWAQEPVAQMLHAEVLRGVTRSFVDPTGEQTTVNELKPIGTTTREQALIAVLRFSQKFEGQIPQEKPVEQTPVPTPDSDVPDPDGNIKPIVPQKPDTEEEEKPTDKTPQPVPEVENEVPKEVPDTLPQAKEEKMEFVFGATGSFFETPDMAKAAMTEIAIPVWRLKDGAKTADKAYITVNRNLAAIFTAIFVEIHRGDEKFPIADVGGYAWRASPTSEHRWGTAVDINYDANMEATLNPDGTLTPTTGTHWTPGEDPLSIPADGDVVNAFNRYGFYWGGGDAWRTKRDYMHFSYFGT